MCRCSSHIEENKVVSAKDTHVRQEEKSSMQMHTWTFLRDFSWPANKAFDLHTRDRRPFHRSSWITPRHWTRPCWPMFHLPFLTHRFLDADLAQFYIEITAAAKRFRPNNDNNFIFVFEIYAVDNDDKFLMK